MCGIAGILRPSETPIPDAWLDRLDERIAYRGPDGAGRFRDTAHVAHPDGTTRTVQVALVHRRLSIIDIDDGAQPMVSEHGRNASEGLVAVVFNGCIYNHRELRAELEARGHVFTTDHSDTEVFLHGYREWGAALDERLEGMYAAAVWDRGTGALALFRDWFGEKPLYVRFGLDGGGIVFASDALGVATFDGQSTNMQRDWVETYLQLGYNWRGRTAYGSSDTTAVVAPPLTIGEHHETLMPARATATTPAKEIEAILDTAVARRLEADVPLGCFLSGGIDSSLIAALAMKHQSGGRLKTFTVRMPDPRYDESRHAEHVADHLKTDHETLEVPMHPADDLVMLIDRLGQPFGDSSILPTYWVSRAARERVKVALSGDGGDELFVGYRRYTAARHVVRHRRLLRWLPASLLQRAHPKSRWYDLGRTALMARDISRRGVLAMESLFDRIQLAQLLGHAQRNIAEFGWGFDPLQDLRRADLMHYLPGDLLTKVDTASMAVDLEVRAPFLDRDLVRAALACQTFHLMSGNKRKGLLREIARRHLPADIIDRPKQGFAIPIGEWFRDDYGNMKTLLLDHLNGTDPFGPFDLKEHAVRAMVDEHLNGVRDHGQRIFCLLTLMIWARGRATRS